MRKGIMSLSLPGMRRGPAKSKTGNMANAEQAAERKAAVHEEPKLEIKGEKPYVQTIYVPKQLQTGKARGRKGAAGTRGSRRTEEKK